MVLLDSYTDRLKDAKASLDEVYTSLITDDKKNRVEELSHLSAEPTLWDDIERAQAITKELSDLKSEKEQLDNLVSSAEDIDAMIELIAEEDDEDLVADLEDELKNLESNIETIRIKSLLTGEYDSCDAILSLHAGAGGTESCDWASMLYRMYSRWAEKKGFKVTVLDMLDGEEAGIKSVTFQISGSNAYGFLKSESGVHRLVRISPFNAAGKRQTSFVSCEVMPEIDDDIDIQIDDKDLRIDTYRSSGAGGQHINKTSSAIRITHLPTGIVVQCQNERSQHMNKDKAMQMLKSKLYILKQEENEKKADEIKGEKMEIGWGSQIRSYVLQPYTMAKDTRTGAQSSDVAGVLDGDIDLFIEAYLKNKQQ